LALVLLSVALFQQENYYDWFFRAHPKAFEIDYAYNPPARLVALVICGPGLLIPFGTSPYDSTARWIQGISIFSVMAFWFSLGWLVDRRSRGRGPIIHVWLLRSAVYCVLLVMFGFLCWTAASVISSQLRFPTFYEYLRLYGLRARILLDFVATAWFGGLSAFCLRQFVVSLKGALRGSATDGN
jgi:hypothetical protein